MSQAIGWSSERQNSKSERALRIPGTNFDYEQGPSTLATGPCCRSQIVTRGYDPEMFIELNPSLVRGR